MGRGKIPMALIPDVRKRNQVFGNRRKGLLKKCEELSTLCGIEVCMISSPPESSNKQCFKTQTYPEDADEVKRIVEEYYRVLAVKGGNYAKNQVTLTDVLRDKEAKLKQELALLRQPPSSSLEEGGLDGMTESSLRSMAAQLDGKLASIKAAIVQRCQEAVDAIAEPSPYYYNDNNYFKVEQSSGGCGVDRKTAIAEPFPYAGDSGSLVEQSSGMVWNTTMDCMMPENQAQPLDVSCEGFEFVYYDMES